MGTVITNGIAITHLNPKSITPGASNYNDLTNKPKINGIELSGDKSSKDLGIVADAIITVTELPSEGIKNCFYQLATEQALYAYIDGKWVKIAERGNDYSILARVRQYLYDVAYDNVPTDEEAEDYLASHYGGFAMPYSHGGCTSFAKGQWGVHIFDWYKTHLAEFRISLPHRTGKHASQAMGGNVPGLTDEFVNSREYSEKYRWLPFTVVDGQNDTGLFCSVNVVSAIDGERTTGTNPGKPRMNAMRIVRYILDTHDKAIEAVKDVAFNWDVYTPAAMGQEYHWLVSDGSESYILEFKDNAPVITQTQPDSCQMTNFRVDGITYDEKGRVDAGSVELHGQGLERFDLLTQYRDVPFGKEELMWLAEQLRYTKCYEDALPEDASLPALRTEFCGIYPETSEHPLWDLTVKSSVTEFRDLWKIARGMYLDPNARDNGDTWHSEHVAIYDILAKKMTLAVQEDYDTTYEFGVGDTPQPEPEPFDADDTLVFAGEESEDETVRLIDTVRPEANKAIVAEGTARHIVVTEVIESERLIKVLGNEAIDNCIVLSVTAITRKNESIILTGTAPVRGGIIACEVKYKSGEFSGGIVIISRGGESGVVRYDEQQPLSEDEQNRARRNIGAYGHEEDIVGHKFAWDGEIGDRETVTDSGKRTYVLIDGFSGFTADTVKEVTIDSKGRGYATTKAAICVFDEADTDDMPYIFVHSAELERVVTHTALGYDVGFPANGIWVRVPGTIVMDVVKNVVVKVPEEYLPEFARPEDIAKTMEMLKQETQRATDAENQLAFALTWQGFVTVDDKDVKISLYRGLKENLPSGKYTEGGFYVCEDTGELFFAKSDAELVQIGGGGGSEGIPDAPVDENLYGRGGAAWKKIADAFLKKDFSNIGDGIVPWGNGGLGPSSNYGVAIKDLLNHIASSQREVSESCRLVIQNDTDNSYRRTEVKVLMANYYKKEDVDKMIEWESF